MALNLQHFQQHRALGVACLFLVILGLNSPIGPSLRAEETQSQSTFEHSGSVDSVAFSPDGKTLAATGRDFTVWFWDMGTNKNRVFPLGGNSGPVAFSPDGNTVALGNWNEIWAVKTALKRASLRGGRHIHIHSVAFSPDGKTLATADDESVALYEVATGQKRASLLGPTMSVAFSPDGKTLASGSQDKTVKLWDLATGKERATLRGHNHSVYSVAFGPDGKTVASGSVDTTIKLWDITTGLERVALRGHTSCIWCIAFSPDGKTLASGSSDTTVRLWDLNTGQERASLQGHSDRVYSVAFSPDGKTLASGSEDKTVKLWNLLAIPQATTGAGRLLAKDLDALWAMLADDDAEKAYQAIKTLLATPVQAVLLVKDRLPPVPEPNAQQITRLISDLDSDQFIVRQKAHDALDKLGEQPAAALRKKLMGKPSLEVVQRIEPLLAKIDQLSPESLRILRAVEVLEHIGSVEARQVLAKLAAGADGFRLTTEAKASLERLNRGAAANK